jgi:hypothetical protein
MNPAHCVDANLTAYGRGDLDGLAATLAEGCTMGAYGGAVFAIGRAACREAYARTIETYPLALTRSLNRIAFQSVVIDHESSRRAKDGAHKFVATFYTIVQGLITRIETVQSKEPSSAVHLAQAQLDLYNAHDLDGYIACLSEQAQIADFGGAVTQGDRAAIRDRYAALFAEFPRNRAALINRIAVGSVAIDHERVTRTPGGGAFEALAIMSVAGGAITRVEFVK